MIWEDTWLHDARFKRQTSLQPEDSLERIRDFWLRLGQSSAACVHADRFLHSVPSGNEGLALVRLRPEEQADKGAGRSPQSAKFATCSLVQGDFVQSARHLGFQGNAVRS